jgi:hypothetical protein
MLKQAFNIKSPDSHSGEIFHKALFEVHYATGRPVNWASQAIGQAEGFGLQP